MDFRKGSASILCATVGLGISQNFAVSAAGQKRCGDQTLKRDGRTNTDFTRRYRPLQEQIKTKE